MKEFFNKIGAFFSSDGFKAVAVAIVVGLFAVWYGAWWSLIVALPLINDIYVGHNIRRFHARMSERYGWWRVAWAVWCSLGFAVVVG